MFSAEYREGQWGPGRLLPYGPIDILPGARALQYGELVFAGLKAYRIGQSQPNLFRPDANFRHMQLTAKHQTKQPVPEELFFEGLETVTRACAQFIPASSGQALYL